MSPTTWSSASSTTPKVPSPAFSRHRTWTLTTLHSASCSPKHTETMPITAIQKPRQSVNRSWSVVVDRTGKPVERNRSNAQVRTSLDEYRQMIIAEYCEKIGHHELQKARVEQERRIPREELRRQQMGFREVHQQSLAVMEEVEYTFIQTRFHPMTLSSKHDFIQNTFIQQQFHLMNLWVILAYMCVKLLVRLHVCHRVGSIWGPFGVHFGSILGPFWVHFGVHLGSILGPFGVHFGSILGSIWSPFGLLSEC